MVGGALLGLVGTVGVCGVVGVCEVVGMGGVASLGAVVVKVVGCKFVGCNLSTIKNKAFVCYGSEGFLQNSMKSCT